MNIDFFANQLKTHIYNILRSFATSYRTPSFQQTFPLTNPQIIKIQQHPLPTKNRPQLKIPLRGSPRAVSDALPFPYFSLDLCLSRKSELFFVPLSSCLKCSSTVQRLSV
ncbi:hypothetical protein JTE90_024217 [Oedothorax gibbosus]|uniref:Uncharacterized protein n=1 Tax=Oedothorax gibbosus TaxID=931172 RepID=A0AAV6U8C6_9ARAC|nr:hypothetical protein JTE90_024217 [Oedothorax gibbosus]